MKNFKNRKMTRITILSDRMFHVVRKGKCKEKKNLMQPKIFFADSKSIDESLYDYLDCVEILKDDKIARRWFLKITREIKLGNRYLKDYIK